MAQNKNEFKFFGEWVLFEDGNEEDKKDAKIYLDLWKKFLLRKLQGELSEYEPVLPEDFGQQFIERPASLISPTGIYGTIGYKISFRKKLPYELR